jgi:hypothetical protein
MTMPTAAAPRTSSPRRLGPGRVAGFIGARLASHTTHRLARLGRGEAAQKGIFEQLLSFLSDTAFGRQTGLEPGLDYETFRNRIAPRTYEDFAPFIERMKLGESGVLCPGRCAHFAVSSGTTAGTSKWLPVNRPMLQHFRATGLDSLFFYAQRTGSGSVFRGRHLFLGGSSALTPLPAVSPPVYYGDLSGIAALNLPGWVGRFLYEPGIEIAQMADWPAKLEAIAHRTRQADITMVAGIPSWLLVLSATMCRQVRQETGREITMLREIWPNLECLVHGGVPVAPFAEELRSAFGAGVNFHEVYPASEGFIAVQDAEPAAGLRLLTDRGLFFEFLSLADYNDGQLARALPLAGVRAGVDYVLLLTTPAGLVRYIIGDVVRFTSTEPPRLVYAGRTKLQLSAFGEHVIERELTDTITQACQRHGVSVVNFHVAPLFPDPKQGRLLGRHEWWIELRRAADARTPHPAVFAAELDRELAKRNDDYAAKRSGHGLVEPKVHFVRSGLFEDWLKRAGKWGGQNKTPRCCSDRRIADQLAATVQSTRS